MHIAIVYKNIHNQCLCLLEIIGVTERTVNKNCIRSMEREIKWKSLKDSKKKCIQKYLFICVNTINGFI